MMILTVAIIAVFFGLHHNGWMPLILKNHLKADGFLASTTFVVWFAFFCWLTSLAAIISSIFTGSFVRIVTDRDALIGAVLFAAYIAYTGYRFVDGRFLLEPLTHDDYLLHYAQAVEVCRHLHHHCSAWGYTPFTLAGDLTFGIDALWSSAFMFVLEKLIDAPGAFNISVLSALWLPVVFAAAAARNFGLSRLNVLGFIVFSAAMVIGFRPVRAFYYFGCFGYVVAFFTCLYTSSLLFRYIETSARSVFFKMIVWGIAALLIHPLAAVLFCSLAIPIFAISARKITAVQYGSLAIGLLFVAFVVLSWWMGPVLRYFSYPPRFMQASFGHALRTLTGDRPLLILIAVLIVTGFPFFSRERRVYVVMLSSAICNGILAFAGTSLGWGVIEPARFFIPFGILLSLALMTRCEELIVRRRMVFPVAMTLVLIAMISRPQPSVSFGFGHDPSFVKVLEFFKAQQHGGRILCQTSPAHPYADCHVINYLSCETHFETTGSEFPSSQNTFPQFIEDTLFGYCIREIPQDTLRHYCGIYAVRYALVYSQEAKDRMRAMPFCKEALSAGGYSVFICATGDSSWTLDGNPLVNASYDEITVQNAGMPTTVLKYHYFPVLKIQPANLSLMSRYIGKDPMPFIQVNNGAVRSFRIYPTPF
jgi:hypothetical protein